MASSKEYRDFILEQLSEKKKQKNVVNLHSNVVEKSGKPFEKERSELVTNCNLLKMVSQDDNL